MFNMSYSFSMASLPDPFTANVNDKQQRGFELLTNFSPTKRTSFRCFSQSVVMATARATLSNAEPSRVRPIVNFPPSVWPNYFLSMKLNETKFKSDSAKVEVLKEDVKRMLMTCGITDPAEKIRLIDTLWCLGVSYHFENEIEVYLRQIFYAQPHLFDEKDYDLYTVALVFRVFRQHGYRVTSDIFNKFKESDGGKFKQSLVSDTKGLLYLYEAAHLSIPGEDVLDEALAFTKKHLEEFAKAQSTTRLGRRIINALKHPLHKTVPRLIARNFIDLYGSEESQNPTLLKFAKLDYNRLQFLHQKELKQILMWWYDTKIPERLSFTRDRMVEVYFWMMALRFEPNHARSRVLDCKFLNLFSITDDVFDAYGFPDELQCFTEAIQRWDYGCLDQLPDYMKLLYRTILDTYSEYENEVTQQGRSYSINHGKEAVKEIVRAYWREFQWMQEGYVPSLDEYLSNAQITTGVCKTAAVVFMGMGPIAGIKEFEWLASNPRILRLVTINSRLVNDILSHMFEQEREHGASSIECYMNQHGVSQKEAIEECRKMIVNGWKEINQECMRPTEISMKLLNPMVNFLRLMHAMYTDVDAFTNPKYLKGTIKALYVDPIPA